MPRELALLNAEGRVLYRYHDVADILVLRDRVYRLAWRDGTTVTLDLGVGMTVEHRYDP